MGYESARICHCRLKKVLKRPKKKKRRFNSDGWDKYKAEEETNLHMGCK